jgi:hypothetical protein
MFEISLLVNSLSYLNIFGFVSQENEKEEKFYSTDPDHQNFYIQEWIIDTTFYVYSAWFNILNALVLLWSGAAAF